MKEFRSLDWSTPVQYLKGVGANRAALLARLDIHTVRDLLLTLPRRYEDRRTFRPLRDLQHGEWAAVHVQVSRADWKSIGAGKGHFDAIVSDATGVARCRWYNAPYLKDQLAPGVRLILYGRAVRSRGALLLEHPELERVHDGESDLLNIGRIVPVYPSTEQLGQRALRRMVWNALEIYSPGLEDPLPESTRLRWQLPELRRALREVHFPDELEQAARARARLVFEEFLCMQLVLAAKKRRLEREVEGRPIQAAGRLREQLLASLPFTLTEDQRRALSEILSDMARPHPMHRLLQGDVGSGKTIVAACAAADAIECGLQVAMMAPTELLAQQHARTFERYLHPLGIRSALLIGSLGEREKALVRQQVAEGRIHLVAGTHALIQEQVEFRELGLVIIDEQHKFGVEQRGRLYRKGTQPHVLVMTATPIPRTLAMTWYGDLDVTIIRQKPPGRQPPETRVIRSQQLPLAYDFIRKQVAKGRQAYVVYPLVEESEQLEVRAATQMFEELRAGPLAGLRLGLVHGRMSPAERDIVMEKFRRGEIDVVVSTTVIEVGVDVPNATVMLIEHAERFGLAQLHQLRGRIGRGENKSFCILQGDPKTKEAWKRLKVLEQTHDGFRIAEEDFRIRGMGNLLGREQSGAMLFRNADPLQDVALLESARREAFRLIDEDPHLQRPEHQRLREAARALYRAAEPFVKVG
ncbi:MAG: ATP-dependent DNA helicase RecG [Kiritimatiellae bacterium]|nr:ATP-dependent DNA helicase RecG [Kiritimatiellia bacterium]MDW8459267.1 ATP-dependent DNA helicase RecG [Verrucomicrobiota bacterium]